MPPDTAFHHTALAAAVWPAQAKASLARVPPLASIATRLMRSTSEVKLRTTSQVAPDAELVVFAKTKMSLIPTALACDSGSLH